MGQRGDYCITPRVVMVVKKYIRSLEKFDAVMGFKDMDIFFCITFQMYYFYDNKKTILPLKFSL